MTAASKPSPKPAPKPTVFMGSSSEGQAIVDQIVPLLAQHFDVRPWNQVFQPGKFTLEVLLDEVARAHAAIFIFTKDDTRELRGERGQAARDNVVLEFGFFVSKLGRDLVWILEEEGVGAPSDLLGLHTYRLKVEDEVSRNARLNTFVKEVQRAWAGIDTSATSTAVEDGNLGFALTLQRERARLSDIADRLKRYGSGGRSPGTSPITFDSGRAAVSAYAEALALVRERFWTTSFLDSMFWTRNEPQVIDANRNMMERLAGSDSGRGARRLFLLDQPFRQVAQAYKTERVNLHQFDKTADIARLDSEFRNLRNNIKRMQRDGFEVRVAHDANEAFRILPLRMIEDPRRCEVAIYDSFRVDIFEGGRSGRIDLIRSFNPAVASFDVYLNRSVAYFEELWAEAVTIDSLLDQINSAIISSKTRVDYASNWLARYEFALDPEDEQLKATEIKHARDVLHELDRWQGVRSYLDIGTCTGRYPILLRDAVAPDGVIIGIDEDFDCVRFAQSNVERQCADDARITIRQADFSAPTIAVGGPFDLITCMLGTLSHFGWDRSSDRRSGFDDTLQAALERMSKLLSQGGLLLLSTWSQYACRNRAMLGIYRDSDRSRLASWTPEPDELQVRLQEAGLKVLRHVPMLRLDVFACGLAEEAQDGGTVVVAS